MGLKGERHPNAKLSEEQVHKIRELHSMGFSTQVIARNFKVSKWNVDQICKNKTWTHLTNKK